jgi:predicted DNA-binding transcriptional regulator YafY
VEFKRWLKGFGAMAEILKPAWLREEIRAELEAAAERYRI